MSETDFFFFFFFHDAVESTNAIFFCYIFVTHSIWNKKIFWYRQVQIKLCKLISPISENRACSIEYCQRYSRNIWKFVFAKLCNGYQSRVGDEPDLGFTNRSNSSCPNFASRYFALNLNGRRLPHNIIFIIWHLITNDSRFTYNFTRLCLSKMKLKQIWNSSFWYLSTVWV